MAGGPGLPMRPAASAHQREEKNGSDNGDQDGTETAEPIRKEGKHLWLIAPATLTGFINQRTPAKGSG